MPFSKITHDNPVDDAVLVRVRNAGQMANASIAVADPGNPSESNEPRSTTWTADKGDEVMNKRLRHVLDIAEKFGMCIGYADDYAEPGYSLGNKDGCIFIGNWNSTRQSQWEEYPNGSQALHTLKDDTPCRIAHLLEKMGHDLEWEDEWLVCECGKAFRTSPDSYGWQMYGYIGNGDYACGDCVREDPESFIDKHAGDCTKAITIPGFDLEKHGYVNLNRNTEGDSGSFESGLHSGQNDDPKKIAQKLEDAGITDYVFKIDEVGQFDAHFSVWVKRESLGLSKESDWDAISDEVQDFAIMSGLREV